MEEGEGEARLYNRTQDKTISAAKKGSEGRILKEKRKKTAARPEIAQVVGSEQERHRTLNAYLWLAIHGRVKNESRCH